jgi:prepilin-type N-terminal cleavage/methylation domain-containing protein
MSHRPQRTISAKNKARGFTLIEMMAALTLLGLIAGLLMPNFQRWYASTQDRVNASAIAIQFQKLYARAALLSQDHELSRASSAQMLADGQPALSLPPGWQIAPQQSLRIPASGYCQSGYIDVLGPHNVRLRFNTRAPHCEVTHQTLPPEAR